MDIHSANNNEIYSSTPIQEFYTDSNIFITGATGFLGRILLEKLLRSCPDLSTIYILARSKKGKNMQDRIDQLLEDAVFDRLKEEQPKFRHKIVGVAGDASLPNLGINEQDQQMLISQVSVVFHVAATVRFDEKLKVAIATNVRGPRDVINLARRMRNLKSLVHVSTAYSNVPSNTIEEKFYPAPIDGKNMILLADILPEPILEKITPTIVDKWPNTYTYTKQIAEDIVREEGQGMPVAIFRPSIVVSTYREPLKGWINNLYGPTGVSAGAGTGVIRTLHADSKVNANIVPVDMCVNALIATAWEVGTKYAAKNNNNNNSCENHDYNHVNNINEEIPIYHFESSNDQPINWGRFMYWAQFYGIPYPSTKAIWYYYFNMYSNFYVYWLATFFLHLIPALVADIGLLCVGKAPKMLKIYKKIHKFTNVISYFSTRNWKFESKRVTNMVDNMSQADQKIFFCDLRKLDWIEFFSSYLLGIRLYLIQDPIDTLSYARVKWQRLYWCHVAIKIVVSYVLFRWVWFILTTIYDSIII